MNRRKTLLLSLLLAGLAFAGCDDAKDNPGDDADATSDGADSSNDADADADGQADSDGDANEDSAVYSVGVIATEAEGGRTLYLHTVNAVDGGQTLSNANAIEFGGNSRHWEYNGDVFIGKAESPVIEKWSLNAAGQLVAGEKLRIPATAGISSIPAGHVFLSETEAWLFNEKQLELIVWDPSTMLITETIDLTAGDYANFELASDGYTSTELWNVAQSDDYVYVPVRNADYASYAIKPEAAVAVFRKSDRALLGIARNDDCVASGRPVVSDDGYVYVITDGRSHIAQAVVIKQEKAPPTTCILRIKDGETSFDADYKIDIPTELDGASAASEFYDIPSKADSAYFQAFVFDELVDQGYTFEGFGFWSLPVFRTYQVDLGDDVTFTDISGDPDWGVIGFGGAGVDDAVLLAYPGATAGTNDVYALDPSTGSASFAFTVEGQLRDAYRLR